VTGLGSVIRKRREALGLTVEGLAGKAGINKGTMSGVEREETNYERGTIDKIATALGTTTDALYAEAVAVKTAEERVAAPETMARLITRLDVQALLVWCERLNDDGLARLVENAELLALSEKYRLKRDAPRRRKATRRRFQPPPAQASETPQRPGPRKRTTLE
jgi:transcriptional regulator with XRE-family HTH domain